MTVENCNYMPNEIKAALERLKLSTWNPQVQKEYKYDFVSRNAYSEVIEAECSLARSERSVQLAKALIVNGQILREKFRSMKILTEEEAKLLDDELGKPGVEPMCEKTGELNSA